MFPGILINLSISGEDIHFSYAIQKHLGLPTIVPPHPSSDLSMWGSSPKHSRELGRQEQAISQSLGSMKVFEDALQHYRKKGFKVRSENESSVSSNLKKYPKFVYWIARFFPGQIHSIAQVRIVRWLFGIRDTHL